MDYPMIDNTDAYIAVCEKANLPINKVPKKGDDISLAYEMAMKELNPHLYQNITSLILMIFLLMQLKDISRG